MTRSILPRSPVTHKMRPWVVKLFIQILPKVLFIGRPKKEDSIDEDDHDKHGGVFDVPSEIDKYLGYDRGYSFDYGVPPPLPAIMYGGGGGGGVGGDGGGGCGTASAAGAAGSNDTVVNMASDDDEDEDAIEIDAEDEYDDMFSPTTTTDDGLASPTFESHHHHHHHQQHHPRCPIDQQQRPKHDAAMQTIQDAKFIAQHVKNQDKFDEV